METGKSDLANMKMKIVYGNKAFEISGEMDSTKTLKYNKIVYFIIKTEEEDFSVVIEKNFKTIARVNIGAE